MSDGFDPILQQAEQRRLREQVLWRLGIAAGLIAVVLGGIYLLDRPDEKPQLETPAAPRIAPQLTEAPAPTPEPTAAAASEPAAASAPASAPAATSPIPSAVPTPQTASSTPLPTSTPISGKVPVRAATPSPAPPASPHTPAPAQASSNPPRATAVPAQATPRRNNSQAETLLQPQSLLAGPGAADAVRGPNGYTVQAGVFLHSDNAEKLLKRVQAAGIPAYLETRVQIGPFKNKAEADAAASKLRALGIEPVLKNN